MDKLESVAQGLLAVETLDGEQFEALYTGAKTAEDIEREVREKDEEINRVNAEEAAESEKLRKEEMEKLRQEALRAAEEDGAAGGPINLGTWTNHTGQRDSGQSNIGSRDSGQSNIGSRDSGQSSIGSGEGGQKSFWPRDNGSIDNSRTDGGNVTYSGYIRQDVDLKNSPYAQPPQPKAPINNGDTDNSDTQEPTWNAIADTDNQEPIWNADTDIDNNDYTDARVSESDVVNPIWPEDLENEDRDDDIEE